MARPVKLGPVKLGTWYRALAPRGRNVKSELKEEKSEQIADLEDKCGWYWLNLKGKLTNLCALGKGIQLKI